MVTLLGPGKLLLDRQVEGECRPFAYLAANVDVAAMQIEDRDGERVLSLCGTVLNHEALTSCAVCGTQMEPYRYLEYVRKRTKGIGQLVDNRPVCDACGRQSAAKGHAV